ncbi:MAG TPA: hypothetical protein VLL51_09565 [Gemmatimonadales bacterium]|nr:hypothetical protein [Gemmatimonadales bacterium]
MPVRTSCRLLLVLGLALGHDDLASQAEPPVTLLPAAPVSARNASLAGAATAMIGYAGSVFTNPSGIAPIRIMSLEGGFARLSDSTTYLMGAAAVRLGPVNVGAGARYLRFDAGHALYDNLETVLAGVARIHGIALGVAGNYFAIEDSAGRYTRSVTTDASLTVAFFDIAALALSVQNIGTIPVSGESIDLPGSVRLGFSLNLIDTYSNWRLLATVEQVWSEGDARTLFGLEGGAVFYGVGLVGRFGAGAQPAGSPYSSPAWGASLVLGRGAVDYAYARRPGLKPVHLIGLRLTP